MKAIDVFTVVAITLWSLCLIVDIINSSWVLGVAHAIIIMLMVQNMMLTTKLRKLENAA